MYVTVNLYRVVCFRAPVGPWRLERSQAHRDAVDERLGSYDEEGKFWATVPGDIEVMTLPVHLIEAALAKARPRSEAA
jgi:hypothetical protein